MTSLAGQNPEEQATPAATGEAHVCVTQIDSPNGLTTTVTITGTAEQVRTAQQTMSGTSSQPERTGIAGLQ